MNRVPRRGEPSGGMPPTAVLALAVPVILACLLLLIGPFYAQGQTPYWLLQVRLQMLLGDHLPPDAASLLHEDLPGVLLMFCVVLLGVIPYQMAKRAHAVRRREAADAARSRAGQAASGEPDAEGSPAPTLDIGIADLRARARRAGIPWDAAYETEGGARGLLEILRVLHRDPADSDEGATGDRSGEGAEPEMSAVPAVPGGEGELPSGAAPVMPESVMPDPVVPDPVVPDPVAATAVAPAAVALTDVAPTTEAPEPASPPGAPAGAAERPRVGTSWNSASFGSVYASTSLYTSERLEGRDGIDDDEEER